MKVCEESLILKKEREKESFKSNKADKG